LISKDIIKANISLKERHDLEKAALDDPFLADALEGYLVTGVNTEADIQELKKRLSERVEEQKAAPLNSSRRPFSISALQRP
jgi:DnaJ-domain-containing protein 1